VEDVEFPPLFSVSQVSREDFVSTLFFFPVLLPLSSPRCQYGSQTRGDPVQVELLKAKYSDRSVNFYFPSA